MSVRYVLDVAKRRVIFNSKGQFKWCITFPVKRVEKIIDGHVEIREAAVNVVFCCNNWQPPKTNPVIYNDGKLLQITELLQIDRNGKAFIFTN